MDDVDYELDGTGHENSAVLVSLQTVIGLLGLVGNIMVLFVVCALQEQQKSITQWYICQLAIADTMFLLTVPVRIVETMHNGTWQFSEWFCKAKEGILFLNYYSSILFLVVMSIDRYIAVCHPFSKRFQKLRRLRSSYAITGAVWILSSFLCVPVLISVFKVGRLPECKCEYDFNIFFGEKVCSGSMKCSFNSTNMTQNRARCENSTSENYDYYAFELYGSGNKYSNQTGNDWYYKPSIDHNFVQPTCDHYHEPWSFHAFLTFNFSTMFVFPIIIMILCYGLIVHRVATTRMNSKNISGGGFRTRAISSSERNRKRVTAMCAVLVSSFIVCWLPYHSVHLAKIAGIEKTSMDVCMNLGKLGSILAYLNSAMNPYLYSFMGSNFRKKWRAAQNNICNTFTGKSSSSVLLARKPARSSRKYKISTNSTSSRRVSPIYMHRYSSVRHSNSATEKSHRQKN